MRDETQQPLRAAARALALGLVVLLAAVACSGGGDDDESFGGAEAVPGPVPSDVTFVDDVEGGIPAPDFSVDLIDGTEFTASDLWADRPVVVLFTASWCEACKAEHEKVAEVVAEHEGVAMLAVVPGDDAEPAAEYAKALELDHPVAVGNDDVWLNWAAREPPLIVLVAPGGRVIRGWPGGVEPQVLAEELDALYEGATSGR
jgi:thiol-disulfide isomerase/thioredoxin